MSINTVQGREGVVQTPKTTPLVRVTEPYGNGHFKKCLGKRITFRYYTTFTSPVTIFFFLSKSSTESYKTRKKHIITIKLRP